jgi:glycine/D-amino acid oxidase-like deaminating enzyme
MPDYRQVSWWLESSGDDLTPRAPLDGSTDADVAILGAGYTGLWAAWYLLSADPSLRVVVLDEEIAGYGASGRNGAWCPPGLNISLHRLAKLHGRDRARRTWLAVSDAVDEVGRVAALEGIDIEWRRGGQLDVARGSHEMPALEAALDELRRFDLDAGWQLLDREQVAARVRIAAAESGLFTPDAAALHPGKLARQLARLVERRGGVIHERTRVTAYRPRGRSGDPTRPVLVTDRGDVRADTIVLAGEVYLTRLRPLHRALIPAWSQIVLSEPLPDAAWDAIGWRDHELVGSPRLTVVYLSRTTDGRILFGGRGAPYRFGSAITDGYGRHEPTFEMLRRMAMAWFPALADVGFSHAWGGAVGFPRDWHPTILHDRATGIASARGYIGHGVAASNLAGRTLADLILGVASERTDLPLVGHRSRSWEPEPLRWLGVRLVQAGIARVDARAERTGRPPSGRSIAERLARH